MASKTGTKAEKSKAAGKKKATTRAAPTTKLRTGGADSEGDGALSGSPLPDMIMVPGMIRSWVMVVNPLRGNSWSTLFARGGCTSFWANSGVDRLRQRDHIFCYEASPTSAIVATAIVADSIHEISGGEQVVLSRGRILRRPLPFDHLSLCFPYSEMVGRNMRGTLHSLGNREAHDLEDALNLDHNPFAAYEDAPPGHFGDYADLPPDD